LLHLTFSGVVGFKLSESVVHVVGKQIWLAGCSCFASIQVVQCAWKERAVLIQYKSQFLKI